LFAQSAVALSGNALRSLSATIATAPRLYGENATLEAENRALSADNARLREALAQAPEAQAIARAQRDDGGGVVASIVGYDPENVARIVTIDRGSSAGVRTDDGVVDDDGVVGRVVEVMPLSSTVLLLTDGASKVPAVVQRGRWWGIATGTSAHVRMQYISQDAKLRLGDVVVTGEGRSFHSGAPLGTVTAIERGDAALYQTAVVKTLVDLNALDRVVVVPQ